MNFRRYMIPNNVYLINIYFYLLNLFERHKNHIRRMNIIYKTN